MRMIVITLAALAGSSAFGGVISFTPNEITVAQGTNFTLDLAIESAELLLSSQSFDVDILSDELTLSGFEFAAFTRFFELNHVMPNLVEIGWFGTPFTLPFTFGTLTIDTTAVGTGDHTITADGWQGVIVDPGPTERFEGFATVHVVPEPSSLLCLLFGAGMATGLRRRTRFQWATSGLARR